MPRKNLIRTADYFYHVTTRSNHKEWFQLPLEDVWDICMNAFRKAQKRNPSVISQFVLMSNHYHLLIRTPQSDIDEFMYWFNKTISDSIRRESGLENRMFGSNYKWCLITNEKYFNNVFRYIYQNPLRANIVEKCEDYPYSTLFYSRKKIKLPFKYSPLNELEQNTSFLNEAFEFDNIELIRKTLKKTRFEFSKRKY